MIVGLLGIDQHEVGALAVAGLLRDAGMEVIYAGRYNTPASFVRTALDEDADVIGISCHSWEYLAYVPDLIGMIEREGLDVSVVLGGSVITPADTRTMLEAGVAAVFGPDAAADQIVQDIRALAAARQERVQAALRPTEPTADRIQPFGTADTEKEA
ncbi:MAG: cobalamin-dependent protein [Xanthobacteraceae bacterium]|nr:cobalamin-dependent protein [Xanthobacteraceae bacterium]